LLAVAVSLALVNWSGNHVDTVEELVHQTDELWEPA
jgi:hypothetical protein